MFRSLLIAAIAILAFGRPAHANDLPWGPWGEVMDVPRPDLPLLHPFNLPPMPHGDEWHRIANFPDGVKSDCGGRTDEPRCLYEIYIAAIAQNDFATVETVLGREAFQRQSREAFERQFMEEKIPYIQNYRQVFLGRLTCDAVRDNQYIRDQFTCAKKGRGKYVLILEINGCGLWYKAWDCGGGTHYHLVLVELARRNGKWKLIHFREPQWW